MAADPETRTEIYFKRTTEIDRWCQKLEVWEGTPTNKELILRFQRHKFAKNTKGPRVAKLTWELMRICDALKKNLDQLTHRDLEELVAWVRRNTEWKDSTKGDYCRAIKGFYRWFEEEDARVSSPDAAQRDEARKFYQYLSKHVRSKYKQKSLDYSQIITDEDARLLIEKGCMSSMEKAMIAFLHETGCRVGELLNVRIRDLDHKGKYTMVRLDGKTGERRTPIAQSVPYVMLWLADHPYKENPNSLLWVSKQRRRFGEPLRYIGVVRLLTRVTKRAGLRKKFNPHHFRHSRATIIAPKYSESVLCNIMGWTIGSGMPKVYVHLGAGQVEDAFKNNNGLATQEESRPTMQYCVCGTTNTHTAKYCYKCGNPLTVATVLMDDEKKKGAVDEAVELLQRIMSNPELMQKFNDFKMAPADTEK